MSGNPTWAEIETEMRRIGFGMEELGGRETREVSYSADLVG
jgi:hypothetical protein